MVPNRSALRRCCIWKQPIDLDAVGSATRSSRAFCSISFTTRSSPNAETPLVSLLSPKTPRTTALEAAFADRASARFAFQVQHLHLGPGGFLLTPRRFSGLSVRLAEVSVLWVNPHAGTMGSRYGPMGIAMKTVSPACSSRCSKHGTGTGRQTRSSCCNVPMDLGMLLLHRVRSASRRSARLWCPTERRAGRTGF